MIEFLNKVMVFFGLKDRTEVNTPPTTQQAPYKVEVANKFPIERPAEKKAEVAVEASKAPAKKKPQQQVKKPEQPAPKSEPTAAQKPAAAKKKPYRGGGRKKKPAAAKAAQ